MNLPTFSSRLGLLCGALATPFEWTAACRELWLGGAALEGLRRL